MGSFQHTRDTVADLETGLDAIVGSITARSLAYLIQEHLGQGVEGLISHIGIPRRSWAAWAESVFVLDRSCHLL